MDNGIFGVCPHCGIRTIDNRMVLSFSKEYYICTNHKHSKFVPINKLRPLIASVPVKTTKPDMPLTPKMPRENSISWEITRRWRWELRRKKWRKLQGKLTNQKRNFSFAEEIMQDKGSKAMAAVLLEANEVLKEKQDKARKDDLHYCLIHYDAEINV